MFASKVSLRDSKFCSALQGRTIHLMLFAYLSVVCAIVSAAEKPRLFVLTDIGGDPDDQMSMVRLMTYANHIDIEGLAATEVNDAIREGRNWRRRSSVKNVSSYPCHLAVGERNN